MSEEQKHEKMKTSLKIFFENMESSQDPEVKPLKNEDISFGIKSGTWPQDDQNRVIYESSKTMTKGTDFNF